MGEMLDYKLKLQKILDYGTINVIGIVRTEQQPANDNHNNILFKSHTQWLSLRAKVRMQSVFC